jgi:hypothetical protein
MKKPKKKRNEVNYTFFAACYGFPVAFDVRITRYSDVWKEGKRKRYCRTCLKIAAEDLRKQLIEQMKKLGAR